MNNKTKKKEPEILDKRFYPQEHFEKKEDQIKSAEQAMFDWLLEQKKEGVDLAVFNHIPLPPLPGEINQYFVRLRYAVDPEHIYPRADDIEPIFDLQSAVDSLESKKSSGPKIGRDIEH